MAGLIPQNFIDDLLTRIDIIDVVEGYVPLRRAGRNHQARCPFHDEKTPSFTVSQEKQFYHCFGCGAHGTAITFLMEYAGMNFIEAIEDLAGRAGLTVPREGGDARKESGTGEMYEFLEMIVRYYQRQLREHPEAWRAKEYLEKRRISAEVAVEFELGFAPPGWDNLLKDLGGSESANRRLAGAGMIVQRESGGYHDRFRDRLMFPIRDQRGRAIGFGGRVLQDDDTPKYLNSPETPVFHKGRELYGLYQVRKQRKSHGRLYIVEGYMDTLSLAQYGIRNAVATLGTALTREHLEQLFRHCQRMVFCFDGDDAGRKAAWRALEISLPLLREGRQVYFMFMPEGEDPDSFVRTHGLKQFEDPSRYLPLSDYLLNNLKQDIDLSTREGRALLVEKALSYLTKLPAGALLELVLKDIARDTGLPADKLGLLLKEKQPPGGPRPRRVQRPLPRQPDATLVGKAIRLLLHHPGAARLDLPTEDLAGVDLPGMGFLLELLNFIKAQPSITCAGILEHWRASKYGDRLNELAAMESPLTEQDEIESEFLSIMDRIRQAHRKRERLRQTRDIRNIEDLRRFYGSETGGLKH